MTVSPLALRFGRRERGEVEPQGVYYHPHDALEALRQPAAIVVWGIL